MTKAVPVPLTLSLDVERDDAYVEEDVLTSVRNALTDEETGMLAVKNIGIGAPLYRSQLFAAILAVPGTVTVTYLEHDETPFEALAIKPAPGEYYDIGTGALIINGKEDS